MRIRWHHKAEVDLQNLSDYILQENPRAALSVFQKIVTTAHQLADFQTLGRAGRVLGTRELVVTGLPYIVVYRLFEREVVIVGIQHTSRLWPDDFPAE